MLSNTENAGVVQRYLRDFCAFIDRIVYSVMALLFKVFFNIADQNILTGETVKALIGRIQLIVGIFFLFIFAIHIIQVIINPDTMTDSNKGTSNIIVKVLIALFLIASLLPLNISGEEGSWNSYMSDQGILFGTMTFFQNKVIHTNLLGKLILGSSPAEDDLQNAFKSVGAFYNDASGETGEMDVGDLGDYISNRIAKLFVFPNMIDGVESKDDVITNPDTGEERPAAICANDPEFFNEDASVGGLGRYQWYLIEEKPDKVFGYTNNECVPDDLSGWDYKYLPNFMKDWWDAFNWIGTDQRWQFQYLAPFSTVIGIFIIIMLLKFTIDIGIRIFKLVVLRILGPIAAVSYVTPGQTSKMFGSWVNNVASTYLEIFLDLAIIYFVVFVMTGLLTDGMMDLGSVFQAGSGVGIITIIFLIIALLQFGKSAPKYIRQVLGLPEGGSGMFSGLATLTGGLLGAAGIAGGAIAGAAGAALASRERSKDGHRLRNTMAGIGGFFSGGARATRGAIGAENNMGRRTAAMNAVYDANALKIARARADVSAKDRLQSRWNSLIGGEPVSQAEQRNLEALQNELAESQQKRQVLQNIKDVAGSRALTNANTKASINVGGRTYTGNYRNIIAQMKAIEAGTASTNNVYFGRQKLSYHQAQQYISDIEKSATDDFISNAGYGDAVMASALNNAKAEGYDKNITTNPNKLGKTIGELSDEISSQERIIRSQESNVSRQQTIENVNK